MSIDELFDKLPVAKQLKLLKTFAQAKEIYIGLYKPLEIMPPQTYCKQQIFLIFVTFVINTLQGSDQRFHAFQTT